MSTDFNKNEKQFNFNQIKGVLKDIIKRQKNSYVIVELGHENKRLVCLSIKNIFFDEVMKNVKLEDKITIRFYLTSSQKDGHWITVANIITIEPQYV